MSLPIAPGTYGIDTAHSQLGFTLTHLGISTISGTFDRFSGALYVGSSLAETVISIEAEMASINTGHAMRDEQVRGEAYLDVANHPQMLFRSASIEEAGSGYSMKGELTIKGTTTPITLKASYNGSAVFPVDGSTHHGFTATGSISRDGFGIGAGVDFLSDDIALSLNAQFVQPADEA
jgi:polyisoprenoid-binding protein YceI